MKLCTQLFLLAITAFIGLSYRLYVQISQPLACPEFDVNAYWGPGERPAATNDSAAEPVMVEMRAPMNRINELKFQLDRKLKLQPALEGVGYEYGVNADTLQDIVWYWRDYLERWLSREVYFNRMPHFTVDVQGLNIHYVHTRATYELYNKKVYPILLLHGWPGSVREFYELIPKLALPDSEELDVVFEVVAPSLPGYGWSQAAAKPGFGVAEMAIVMRNLMLKLGYERFFVQGGDWGSLLASHIATIFPENVIGYHSNMCMVNTPISSIKSIVASWYSTPFVPKKWKSFHFPLSKLFYNLFYEMGYLHLQATKPDTVGIVLRSNPIGLAAYILEKFSTLTNGENIHLPDGGWSTFDDEYKDAILDNIMVYYLTNSITSAVRLYSESFTKQQFGYQLDRVPTNVPTACARFRHELAHMLDWQLEDKYTNLVQSTYHKKGGHFAALEQPELLFQDFAKFVKKVLK